jgi:hypothetical protein
MTNDGEFQSAIQMYYKEKNLQISEIWEQQDKNKIFIDAVMKDIYRRE